MWDFIWNESGGGGKVVSELFYNGTALRDEIEQFVDADSTVTIRRVRSKSAHATASIVPKCGMVRL